MPIFESNQQTLNYSSFGAGETVFIWAHGWGHNGGMMAPIAKTLTPLGQHMVIDFPGFGASPQPKTDWTIADYANFMHEFIKTLGNKKIVWVGHSFGCRVGIKLAALYPNAIDKLVLIAAAGLPRERSIPQQIKFYLRIKTFKILKHLIKSVKLQEKLRNKFGSSDYNNAGAMRGIFGNTIREVLDKDAQQIKCKTLIICGENDDDTPPDISVGYNKLIKDSELILLPHLNHFTILTDGISQLSFNIKRFIKS